MRWLKLLAVIAGAYFFLILFVSRIFIPFLGCHKPALPPDIPPVMDRKIQEMEQRVSGPDAYAEAAYEFVQSRWHSARLRTIIDLPLAFRTDLAEIWNSPGYAHCNTINYVYYVLLARSRFFRPEDIRFRYKLFNFMIHQYVQIRTRDQWLDADPSLVFLHLRLGRHSGFFG